MHSLERVTLEPTLGSSSSTWEERRWPQEFQAPQMAWAPAVSPVNNMEFCLVMSIGRMGQCREMRKDGGRSWRGFYCQSGEFRLNLVDFGVFKGFFFFFPPETTLDSSVMGRLEGLQDQHREGGGDFPVLLTHERFLFRVVRGLNMTGG